jgi:hypothetical protein
MLFFFLSSRVTADELTLSGSTFFPSRLISVNDIVNVTFPTNNSQGVFVWRSRSADVSVQLTVVSGNGSTYSLSLSASSGVRVRGRGAIVAVDSNVTMQIWVLPDGLCPGPLVVYSSSTSFSDDLRPGEPAPNLCVFFTDPMSLHLTMECDSQFYFYELPDLRSPADKCSGSCVADFHCPSFVTTGKIGPGSRITLSGTTMGAKGAKCRRDFLPLIVGRRITVLDIASDSGNLFSCGPQVWFRYEVHVVAVAAAFVLLISVTILVFVGWWKRLRSRIRGFEVELPQVDAVAAEQIPEFAEVASDDS